MWYTCGLQFDLEFAIYVIELTKKNCFQQMRGELLR